MLLEKEREKLDNKIGVLLDIMSKAHNLAGDWIPKDDGV